MIRYVDMHCHLDFSEDAQACAADLANIGIACLSATVTPDAYFPASYALSPYDNVRVGLGLHPWWIRDEMSAQAYVDSFEEHLRDARFIAEVGLDFGETHVHTCTSQIEVFKRIAASCAHEGEKVLSLHAVRSTSEVMDILENAGALTSTAGNTCIFHWFSGTSDELTRARELGCYFSINPRMLESKRGRAYVCAVPLERLLLETDEPACPGVPFDVLDVEKKLKAMISRLAALRACSFEEIEESILRTSLEILGL